MTLNMSADERILSGEPDSEDLGVEESLRPRRLDEYIGQTKSVTPDNGLMQITPGRDDHPLQRSRRPRGRPLGSRG